MRSVPANMRERGPTVQSHRRYESSGQRRLVSRFHRRGRRKRSDSLRTVEDHQANAIAQQVNSIEENPNAAIGVFHFDPEPATKTA
jgi:hypothetical protein